MRIGRYLLMAALPLAFVCVFTCCRNRGNQADPVPANPPASPAAQSPAGRLPKPRFLGPLTPAVIPLPADHAQPTIRVRLTPEMDAPPKVPLDKYRGTIDVYRLANGKYVAINVLPLEDYLPGVLSKELYPSWHLEAYRAQAIAARTFAWYLILAEGRNKLWDVTTDETTQVYGGIAAETPISRQAVRDTRGQVMTASANGTTGVFKAYFSACAGGSTQDAADAWGDHPNPVYTPRVTGQLDAASPKFSWGPITVTKPQLSAAVRAWGTRNALAPLVALGDIRSAAVTARHPTTNRPTLVTLTGTNGKTAPIRAEELRLALLHSPVADTPKPLSSNFTLTDTGDAFTIAGTGHGHGIGMSQWGAQALAKRGNSHQQILGYYYVGSTVTQAWE